MIGESRWRWHHRQRDASSLCPMLIRGSAVHAGGYMTYDLEFAISTIIVTTVRVLRGTKIYFTPTGLAYSGRKPVGSKHAISAGDCVAASGPVRQKSDVRPPSADRPAWSSEFRCQTPNRFGCSTTA